MALVDFDLLPEHLEACDWRGVLESGDVRHCRNYSHRLLAKAAGAAAELSPSDTAALRYIGGVCAAMLTPDRKEPFEPAIVLANRRSALPTDLSDREVELLRWLVENAPDHPEIRARAADYLWLRKSDHRMAEVAIEAYFESAAELERVEWGPAAVERLSRALGLAAQLGKRNELFRRTLARVEAIADRRDESLSDGFVSGVLHLVLSFRGGDPAVFGEHARLRAERAEAVDKPLLARAYWGMAAKWQARGGDPAGEREALTRLAETYVRDADSAIAEQSPNHMAAASHLERAIEAIRRAGGHPDRVADLRRRMEATQLRSREQLKLISESVDVSDFARQAIEFVRGMPLLDALLKLGLGARPTKKGTVREQVEELSQQTPLQFLIPLDVRDASQRVIARRGSMIEGKPGYEEALDAEMVRHAGYYQVMTATSFVEPARQQIWSEHPCAELDLLPLVSEHPFVPPGHEQQFVRGLHAGLAGDFVQSTHVLGLQIESSLRYVLNTRGVRTTTLQDGIEKEMTLDSLLALPACTDTFGEDLVFDLRALLTDPFGSNLRHRLAHALRSDDEFYGPADRYLWWIALHLCSIPIAARVKAAAESERAEQEASATATVEENGGKNGGAGGGADGEPSK